MSEAEQELQALVPAAVTGDRAALQRILEIIHPLVLRYVRARISNGRIPGADDIAQDACLAVVHSIERYTDRGRPFMAYVYGVVSNKVADARRAYVRDQSHLTDEVPDSASREANPEEEALVTDGSNRVRRLLDSLSERSREIITLRVLVGLSAEETADMVGSTPGAVRVAQHRALASLRKAVEEGER
ncbi:MULTISPECIES: sigma-70 family RNA polymerase sigma factor [unclassified Corynebacterium]|uniref:sigma-70 family RNA polymerase sigma factor n=1 Tax=unclassified Corynebacterium TaxID=2624378 RepID=UPI0029CA54F1|nr:MULTISPECIES: sigma-70 family RNA polymerase sigma factor [unclassified Corynebacterium]WPF66553.1 sigma-70 family RNA polymerase sigma factor [Corynebacterium sp. 22KM0430]WPF69042.1 sigma-70 family RNA polymerase sigma factor [Corynebacterium sp. 21KM1197]